MESPPCSKINALSSPTFGMAFNAVHTRKRLPLNNDNGMANVPGPISRVDSPTVVAAIFPIKISIEFNETCTFKYVYRLDYVPGLLLTQ